MVLKIVFELTGIDTGNQAIRTAKTITRPHKKLGLIG